MRCPNCQSKDIGKDRNKSILLLELLCGDEPVGRKAFSSSSRGGWLT